MHKWIRELSQGFVDTKKLWRQKIYSKDNPFCKSLKDIEVHDIE